MERPPLRTRVLVAATNIVVALWGLGWWLGAASRQGDDTAGHLQRIEAAWGLFVNGRVDGWFDGAMFGYQLHLFYGPGLAIAAGSIKILSMGRASSEVCLDVVLILAFLAVPFALARLGRALGLDWWTASATGTLGLVISSPFGGGIEGGFDTALAAQQVAVPLVVLVLAMMVEVVRGGPGRTATRASVGGGDRTDLSLGVAQWWLHLQLGVVLTVLAMTHPLSLVMTTVMFTPIVLCVAWLDGNIRLRDLRNLVPAIGWFAGLSAFWWLPMVDRFDLRGPVTSWRVPGVIQQARMFVMGERGTTAPFGVVIVVTIVVAVVAGILVRQRRLVALGLLPVAAFASLHLVHGLIGVADPTGMQFPNRGMVYAALLATPVTASVLTAFASGVTAALVSPPADGHRARSRDGAVDESTDGQVQVLSVVPRSRVVRMSSIAMWLLVVISVIIAIGGLERDGFALRRPDHRLVDVVRILSSEMERGQRFAYVDGPRSFGVPQPQRWLAWRSGQLGLASFGPEYAPGSELTMALSRGPGARTPTAWIDSLRRAGVSHVVVADPDLNRRLGVEGDDVQGPVVWRLRESSMGLGASIVPLAETRMIHPDPEKYVVEVVSESSVAGISTALGWSPGWVLQIDGVSTRTWPSRDDTVAFDLPAGSHELRFTFSESRAGPIGRSITLATTLLAASRYHRRRRDDGTIPAPVGLDHHG